MSAHRINKGEMPDCSNRKGSDLFFIEKDGQRPVTEKIVSLVKDSLPKYYHMRPEDIQVLTPTQKGGVGAISLNEALHDALNPIDRPYDDSTGTGQDKRRDGIWHHGVSFRPGDKIMQIRNDYKKGIFNGDIGTVTAIDVEERALTVDFDGTKAVLEHDDLDALAHAYAITVHKSQGSEYPIVVLPVMKEHMGMLERNLIYTAVTRAKKALVMVGSKEALSYAVSNVTATQRNSLLCKRLQDKEEVKDEGTRDTGYPLETVDL